MSSDSTKPKNDQYLKSPIEPNDIPSQEFNKRMAWKLQEATKKLLKDPTNVLNNYRDYDFFEGQNTRIQVFIDHRYDY